MVEPDTMSVVELYHVVINAQTIISIWISTLLEIVPVERYSFAIFRATSADSVSWKKEQDTAVEFCGIGVQYTMGGGERDRERGYSRSYFAEAH